MADNIRHQFYAEIRDYLRRNTFHTGMIKIFEGSVSMNNSLYVALRNVTTYTANTIKMIAKREVPKDV